MATDPKETKVRPPWITPRQWDLEINPDKKALVFNEQPKVGANYQQAFKGHRADPKSQTSKKVKLRTLENLTPLMKAKRDRFIMEFIRDWSGPEAYVRAECGPSTTAAKMSNEYLREPYVRQRLLELVEAMDEAALLTEKTILMGLIREARYEGIGGSHGARVAAWKALANIKGMEKTNVNVNGQVDHNIRGGVMVVPVVPGSEEWEQLASGAQKQLKEDVRK